MEQRSFENKAYENEFIYPEGGFLSTQKIICR